MLIFSASDDGTIKCFTLQDTLIVGVLKGHSGAVTSLSYCKNSENLISGSRDRKVIIWTKINHSVKVNYEEQNVYEFQKFEEEDSEESIIQGEKMNPNRFY